MKILLIRSADRSTATAARLAAFGHEVEFLPVTAISHLPFDLPADRIDGIIFTSAVTPPIVAQAIGSNRDGGPSFSTPAWCVGAVTADAASKSGFSDIRVGPGGARKLAHAIAAHHGAKSAVLYYPSAKDVAFEMAPALAQQQVMRQIVYKATLQQIDAEALKAALQRISHGALLLYSARSTRHFFAQVTRNKLLDLLGSITIIAISGNVADAAQSICGIRPQVAQTPDETAMLALL